MREGRVAEATALAEAVRHRAPHDPRVLGLLLETHQRLATNTDIEKNFWFSGWIKYQIQRFTKELSSKE